MTSTLFALALVLASPQCPAESGAPGVDSVREALTGWSRYDQQTVREAGRVDHAASMRANWAEARLEFYSLTHLDAMRSSEALATEVPILGPILMIATYPFAMMADAIDIVRAPIMMVKHTSDAGVHGVRSIFSLRRRPR